MDFWLYSFHLLRIQPSGLFGGEFPLYTNLAQYNPHIYTKTDLFQIHINPWLLSPF